jgi:hypothetical protein
MLACCPTLFSLYKRTLSTKCAICKKEYIPEPKNRNHQKYCSLPCRKRAKKNRDKRHKREYQKKEKYRLAKREQNKRYRKKRDWPAYIREYRNDHGDRMKDQNRKAAGKYYQNNKRKIAFRRSERRWQEKLRSEIEAIKKIHS